MELIVFGVINILAFFTYGYDKIMAINGGFRISEKTLLTLSLLGGFGSVLGMGLFRHKTRKITFKIASFVGFIISIIIFTYIRG